MSSALLTVSGIGKCYKTYASNRHRYANWFGASHQAENEHWAVSDVSFDVKAGQSVALIGGNGAGKSTLLKLITGTIVPTTGGVMRSGRVSAILELGLGFNPEFTGRANVYQAGGLLGHPRDVLDNLMPEIEAFAELGEFFDQPLRVYSSGMNARLAFSLATAVRPELLIVDEVLSVGDSYFQHKSFARINKFRDEGTSILLVTHSMVDVRALCQRVLLLDKGRVLKDGKPDEVVDFYNALVAQKQNATMTIEQRRQKDGWLLTRSGTSETVVKSLALIDPSTGQDIKMASVGQMLRLRVEMEVNADLPVIVFGVWLRDRTGHSIWGNNTSFTDQLITGLKGGETVTYNLDFPCDLGTGSYSWTIALSSTGTGMYDFEWTDNAIVFDVVNVDREFFIGCNRLAAAFTVERAGQPASIGKRPVLG